MIRICSSFQSKKLPAARLGVGDRSSFPALSLRAHAVERASAREYFYPQIPKRARHPASHGCIRVPLAGSNPAKGFTIGFYFGDKKPTDPLLVVAVLPLIVVSTFVVNHAYRRGVSDARAHPNSDYPTKKIG
jgi:hypothetical protein